MNKKNRFILTVAVILIIIGSVITIIATIAENKTETEISKEATQSQEPVKELTESKTESNTTTSAPTTEASTKPDIQPSDNGKYTGLYKIHGTETDLSLRQGPSFDSNKLNSIPEGTEVEVVAVYNEWGFIKYSSVYGWISLDYTKITEKKNEIKDTSGTYTVTTKETSLTVREFPDKNTGVAITSIPKGESVSVLTTYGNWAYVNYNNAYGWSSLEYLEKE